jgi:PAS domain S-box-containing protein
MQNIEAGMPIAGDRVQPETAPNGDQVPTDELATPRPSAAGAHVDYRTLVEQIPAITYTEIHDANGTQRTTYVSPQATLILGHAPSEFLANPELWRKIRHPGDRATVLAAERTAEVTRQPFHAEYRMFHRDGRLLWFRDDAVIVEHAATGGTFWQGVMFDITAEKHAEESARSADLRYRSLVESLPAVVYVDELDERATNVYTSPGTEQLLGYSVQDWIDDPDLWSKLVHPDDWDRAREAERYHVESGEPYDQVYRMVHRDGRTVWVHDIAVVVRDEDGTPLYSQGFLLDITGQREAETDLQQALDRERSHADELQAMDELKNTLLHTLSHDLKGPITAVLASATMLRRPGLTQSETEELLDGMASRARRMDRLLTDLLDLERLGRGIVEPTRFPVDVGQLVTDIAEHCDVTQGREVELDTATVVVPLDAPKVERMVENLLANAIRHAPRGSRVWVRVRAQEGGAVIAVEDEGPGVPEDLREVIFEPFRKGAPGEDTPGSGIGLSLVASFAELHRGRAWVEDRPGGGASFRIFLPGRSADPS